MASRIALGADVEPAVWPADALVDVRFRLALRNDGKRDAAVYPAAAKLSDVASMAGVGIAWQLHFVGPDGAVPQTELRQWHGPPGNPPSPGAVKQSTEVVLAPGARHEAVFTACWIPNARLLPAHLEVATLDPAGMDGIARISRLDQASVLVFGHSRTHLEPLMASRPDFLRAGFSNVVTFFGRAGEHRLEAAYLQQSWMDIGEKLTAVADPVRFTIG